MRDADPNSAPGQPTRPGGCPVPPLQSLLDAIPYPVFYKDLRGCLLGCNAAFARSRGLPADELIGRTAFDLLPMEEARRLDRKDQELLRTGGTETFHTQVTGPGQARRQVILHKAVHRNADGSPAGIVTTVMDVTEQKLAEAALRRSQDLLTTISRNVADLMSIVGADGVRQYASPSYLTVLGYGPEDLAARPPLELIHPEDRPLAEEALATVLQRGVPQCVEYRIQHKSGTWLHFEAKATPIFQAVGQPYQALIVARDVTARKAAERDRSQMEVQLRHAQKLESIGSLAAGIAHEINTPTQYIGDNTAFLGGALPELMACLDAQRGFLLGLRDQGALPPEGARVLAQLEAADLDYLIEEIPKAIRQTQDGVARVASIVSAMKDFSHPGGEGKSEVDLNRAIESTLTVSRNEWKYVAQLETHLDPQLPPVPCLQGEINQAILNLVVNAAHAIEASLGGRNSGRMGLIRVTTCREGREVRISVADNGQGIPEAIRDRIFEPFFTTKPVGRGTGQGLAIVHAVVVEKHGGRVTLETREGQGTTFHLFLPLETADPAGSARRPARPARPTDRPGPGPQGRP
jgi:PAS domain S-box-containing protein